MYAVCFIIWICVSLSGMCADGALLICFAANRWWVWCFPCLSDCNQSTEGKLSLFVTRDVPKVTQHIKSTMHSIDSGHLFCLSISFNSSLCPGVMIHFLVEIATVLFHWTIRRLKPLFILWLWAIILLLLLSLPSSCAPPWCSVAADAAVSSILILFHHLQTQKQTGGCFQSDRKHSS